MQRYIIEDTRHVPPFNQPASQLTIGVEPLKIHHENMFARYFKQSLTLANMIPHTRREEIRTVQGPAIVYCDSLWFDDEFLAYFMDAAKQTGRACRAVSPAVSWTTLKLVNCDWTNGTKPHEGFGS